MQYIIKDGRGNAIRSLDRFSCYTVVARDTLSIGAVLPFTVWKHNTVTGVTSYDGERTRRLCEGVRMARAMVQS